MVSEDSDCSEIKLSAGVANGPDLILDDLAPEVLNGIPVAIYVTDANDAVTFYNRAAADLWGQSLALKETSSCSSWRLSTTCGRSLSADEFKASRAATPQEVVAERPDGARLIFFAHTSPLEDNAGRLVGAVHTLVDLTSQREAEARQALIAEELKHRLKNMLAAVQALAAASGRGATSLDEYGTNFQARLLALASAHDLLVQGTQDGADLGEIVRQTLAPYAASHGAVSFSGPPVQLTAQAAIAVHMGLHEMATNAAKYGALSVESGRLSVRWWITQEHPPAVEFEWVESGVPGLRAPTREGFGTRLIKAIGKELGARVEPSLQPDGMSFRWTAYASEKVIF